MSLVQELQQLAPPGPTVCTIGVFDGVHQGHRALIAATIRQAEAQNAASVVFVLHPHPRSVLSTNSTVSVITPLDERLRLIRACGVAAAIPVTFTPEVAALSAPEFAEALVRNIHMVGLVVGPDFALGRGRAGDPEALRSIGAGLGFTVTVIPIVEHQEGDKVSSTAVRNALADGDVARVTRMLQRPYITSGTVVHGLQRGRQMGYPTANIMPDGERALPADGIYATRTHVGDAVYDSATYIGTSPTFDGEQRVIEVLLFDFDGDLYDQDLTVEWVDKVRGDRKFESMEALQQQMAKDIDYAKTVLTTK